MPYALWKKRGGNELDKYKIEGMPILPHGVAVEITEEQRKVADHLLGVITFDGVEGLKEGMKTIEFEGRIYHYRDGLFDPPVENEIYNRMIELKLI